MNEYTPNENEVRADFVRHHTRNFDEYQVGRSLTSEQEFYGTQFDRWLERVKAEALREAARDAHPLAPVGGGCTVTREGLRAWLEARATAIENGESK